MCEQASEVISGDGLAVVLCVIADGIGVGVRQGQGVMQPGQDGLLFG